MTNSKNIIIAILIIALVVLTGWTYCTLTVSIPKKAEAKCKEKIDKEVTPQVKTKAQEDCKKEVETQVMNAVQPIQQILQGCQQTIDQLK